MAGLSPSKSRKISSKTISKPYFRTSKSKSQEWAQSSFTCLNSTIETPERRHCCFRFGTFSNTFLIAWSVQIRSHFWSIFSPNTGKYGPKITPHLDTFYAVFINPGAFSFFFPFFRIFFMHIDISQHHKRSKGQLALPATLKHWRNNHKITAENSILWAICGSLQI